MSQEWSTTWDFLLELDGKIRHQDRIMDREVQEVRQHFDANHFPWWQCKAIDPDGPFLTEYDWDLFWLVETNKLLHPPIIHGKGNWRDCRMVLKKAMLKEGVSSAWRLSWRPHLFRTVESWGGQQNGLLLRAA